MEKGKPTLIEFISATCKFSRQMKPIVKELKKKYSSEVDFKIVDVDSKGGIKEEREHGNISTPTFIFVNDKGERISKIVGVTLKEQLEERIGKILPANSSLKKALLEKEREKSKSNPSPTINSIKPTAVSTCD